MLPEVSVFRNLDNFLDQELALMYSAVPNSTNFDSDCNDWTPLGIDNCIKVIAHPLLQIVQRDSAAATLPEETEGPGCHIYPASKPFAALKPADFVTITKDEGLTSGGFQELTSTDSIVEQKRLLVAIGPEGGWEQSEIIRFQRAGFHLVHMGDRILRTDMAVSQLDW